MCQNEENIYANLTISRRTRTIHSNLPPVEQTRSREATMMVGAILLEEYIGNLTQAIRLGTSIHQRTLAPSHVPEAPVLRTPVMGLKAEARRLSYIKKKRTMRRSQSSSSRRSIHRKKQGWLARKPRTAPAFPEPSREKPGRNTGGVHWARTIINRLSFNKFFRKRS